MTAPSHSGSPDRAHERETMARAIVEAELGPLTERQWARMVETWNELDDRMHEIEAHRLDRVQKSIDALRPLIEAEVRVGRAAMRDECAAKADTFTCGVCGMDGKAGAAIREIEP